MGIPKKALLVCVLNCLYVVTSGFLFDPNCDAVPPCTCLWNTYDCEKDGLDSIPRFEKYHIDVYGHYTFNFADNNITAIYDHAFSNITVASSSSIYLELKNNLISSLSDFCFDAIQNSVYQIDLTNNKITRLPKAFVKLTHLVTLLLNKNPLATLDPSVMNAIGRHLGTMEIDMSHFESWPLEFHYLRRLSTLILHSIPFSNLHLDPFRGFENTLSTLGINNSRLEELPIAICHLKSLEVLEFNNNANLVGNVIHTEQCHLTSVRRGISLRYNMIEQFPNILHSGSNFTSVNIGNNRIRYIRETSIPFCTVVTFNLTNNLFARVPTALGRLKYLSKLDLSHNYISTIEEPDLTHFLELTYLYVLFREYEGRGTSMS